MLTSIAPWTAGLVGTAFAVGCIAGGAVCSLVCASAVGRARRAAYSHGWEDREAIARAAQRALRSTRKVRGDHP